MDFKECIFKLIEYSVKVLISKWNWFKCFKEAMDETKLDHLGNYKDDDRCVKVFEECFSYETANILSNISYQSKAKDAISNINSAFKEIISSKTTEYNFEESVKYFDEKLLNHLRNINSVYYILFKYDLDSSEIEEIKSDMESIKAFLNEKLSLFELKFSTLEEEEILLQKKFKDPLNIKLDFFNFMEEDNKEQIRAFLDSENLNTIKICGTYQEETLYAVLSCLKNESQSNVFIINDDTSWGKIQKQFPKGSIIINRNFSGSLLNLADYKSIQILPACYQKDSNITLKPRTMKNFIEAIKNSMTDSKGDAEHIARKCHNIYPIFLKQNINGTSEILNKWMEIDKNIRVASILIQSWDKHCKGDAEIIELLSGVPMLAFNNAVISKKLDQTPFAFENNEFGSQDYYRLCSVDDAWANFYDLINDEYIEKFKDYFIEILKNVPKKYDNYLETKIYLESPHSEFYSNELRFGVLNSLIQIKKYTSYRRNVDSMVHEFVTWAKDVNDANTIFYYSSLLPYFAEASPIETLKFIDYCFTNDTGLVVLFKNKDEDIFFGKNEYHNVIYSLEKLLFFEETKISAVEVMLKIKSKHYDVDSDIKNKIEIALSILIDTCKIGMDEKKKAYPKIFEEFGDESWDILFDISDQAFGFTFPMLYKPNVININLEDKNESYNFDEIFELYKLIYDLLVENTKNGKRWCTLIKDGNLFFIPESLGGYKSYIDALLKYLKICEDDEKLLIQDSILVKLNEGYKYHNLYKYVDFDEAKKELEFVRDNIEFNTPEYEYFNVFKHEYYDLPDSKLETYYKNNPDYDYKKLNDTILDIVKNKEKDFISRRLNIDIFFEYAKLQKLETFNEMPIEIKYLETKSKIKLNNYFSNLITTFKDKNNIIFIISRFLHKTDIDLYFLIFNNFYKNKDYDKVLKTYMDSINIHNINNKDYVTLNKQDVNLKKYFWENYLPSYSCFDNKETFRFVLTEIISHKNIRAFIPVYCDGCTNLNLNGIECYEFLKNVGIEFLIPNHKYSYEIETILNKIVDEYYYTEDEEIKERISYAQMLLVDDRIIFRRNFFYEELSTNPSIYLDLVKMLYFKVREKIDSNLYQALFIKEHNWRFCPGVKYTGFDEKIFKSWIDVFSKSLIENGERELLFALLGRLVSNSPADSDDIIPLKPIRNYIEEIYEEDFKTFLSSFITSMINKRGVHSVESGQYYNALKESELKTANELRDNGYCKTAELYELLAEEDEENARRERANAIHQ